MKNERSTNYGEYNRNYRNQIENDPQQRQFQAQEHAQLGDTRNEPGEYYRIQQSREFGSSGGMQGNREDRYNQMYDTANYSDHPRSSDYGLPYGVENDLDQVGHFPYSEGPYTREPRSYRYTQGYNPNYDNPEEGDRYRDFDSRGNHGFRHEGSYGNQDSFREFGNDRFGKKGWSNNPH
ncbi:hypothetical protein MKJ04_21200 [Pontibacter sp. E15-1]|uniref:hypothetical protein n=1 Tax=Pontibacter sp. E15-1 TaxID=2919918 RepID=UPI001F4F4B21|nr:hypothetical protein [Pontibacter sp. E15-1]MCJ8167372.1 hypothetical protein [Pontibacter sp. E15-1]